MAAVYALVTLMSAQAAENQYYQLEFYDGANCEAGTMSTLVPGAVSPVVWPIIVHIHNFTEENVQSINWYSISEWFILANNEWTPIPDESKPQLIAIACPPPSNQEYVSIIGEGTSGLIRGFTLMAPGFNYSPLREEENMKTFYNPASISQILSNFHTSLGIELTLTNYGDECRNGINPNNDAVSVKWTMQTASDCSSDSSKNKLSTGAIIGISVGGAVGLALILWACSRKSSGTAAAQPVNNLIF